VRNDSVTRNGASGQLLANRLVANAGEGVRRRVACVQRGQYPRNFGVGSAPEAIGNG